MKSALDLDRLATVHVVPPTPFSADGERTRLEALGELVFRLWNQGLRVFIPAAGTGEFHSLSADEAIGCVRATRQALPDQAVVIGAIGGSLRHALEVGHGAIEAGADALLVMPPIHPYLSDAGLRDYFLRLFAALDIPFLAYKRGPAPSDALLAELATTGKLVGVKYAVNDLNAFARFAASQTEKLRLYCGTAERFAPFFMLAGAEGYTTGAGAIFPRLTLALHAAAQAGDFPQAMRYLAALRPIEDFRAREDDSFNISAIKAALASEGYDFGPPRPPARRLTGDEDRALRAILEPIRAQEAACEIRPG